MLESLRPAGIVANVKDGEVLGQLVVLEPMPRDRFAVLFSAALAHNDGAKQHNLVLGIRPFYASGAPSGAEEQPLAWSLNTAISAGLVLGLGPESSVLMPQRLVVVPPGWQLYGRAITGLQPGALLNLRAVWMEFVQQR